MKFTTSLAKIKAANNPRFLDGVATTPNAFTSATAAFVAGDVGKQIVAAPSKVKAGTTIASVTNGTTVVLTHPSGTAVPATGSPFSAVDFRIGDRARTTADIPLTVLPAGTVVFSAINNAASRLTAQADVTKTDAVTNGTTTVTSATFAFVAADVGKTVLASADFAANTTIASVTNGTTVVLNQAALTSGSSKSMTIVNRELLTAATMRVITPGHNYGTAKDALVANAPDADYTPFLENMTASKQVSLRIALTGANISQLTGGSIDTFLNTGSLT